MFWMLKDQSQFRTVTEIFFSSSQRKLKPLWYLLWPQQPVSKMMNYGCSFGRWGVCPQRLPIRICLSNLPRPCLLRKWKVLCDSLWLEKIGFIQLFQLRHQKWKIKQEQPLKVSSSSCCVDEHARPRAYELQVHPACEDKDQVRVCSSLGNSSEEMSENRYGSVLGRLWTKHSRDTRM